MIANIADEHAADGRTTGEDTVTVPAPRDAITDEELLRMQVVYSAPGTAVVNVFGELDLLGAPRLKELVHCRLRSALHTLVLDLSRVTFMSVAGAQVLSHAATFARYKGSDLRIEVGGSRAVERVLSATGLEGELPLTTELPLSAQA